MSLGSFCSKEGKNLKVIQPKSIRITGFQKGFIQFLEIYQSIKSEVDLNEVSYIFPTDNKLCIYNMKFIVGEETIKAEIIAKKAAKEAFKEAVKIGRIAVMTEQESPGITSIKLGNVPKNEIVAIILQCSFTSTLQNSNTILTKIPLQASEPDGSLTDLYNIPSLEIDLDISISQICPISDVYTNCESNYEKTDDCNGKLTIKSAIITDNNILIMTEFTNPVQSQMLQAGNTTAISIIPDFESIKTKNKEFVFLIDCSASMLGESIRKAKESLHLFLSKLPDDSFFNIIRFGTTFEKLFPQSSEKTGKTVKTATEFIEKLRANLGGTQLLSLFDDLFKEDVKVGSQRQVFLITDGEVYEREKVIQKVEENNGFNRFFAIGLGHGADAGFLEEITGITHGKSDFVFLKDELPSKVTEHLDLSFVESATKCEIHIENNDSFQAVPYPLPPLLPHSVSHFFVSSKLPVEGDVLVTGKVDEKDVEMVVSSKLSIDLEKGSEKSPVFALFAQRQLNNIKDDEEKSVSLSMSSGVVCKYTSYIAVSKKSHVTTKKQEKIDKNDENDADEYDEYNVYEEEEEYCEEDMRDTKRYFKEMIEMKEENLLIVAEMMMREEKKMRIEEERRKEEERGEEMMRKEECEGRRMEKEMMRKEEEMMKKEEYERRRIEEEMMRKEEYKRMIEEEMMKMEELRSKEEERMEKEHKAIKHPRKKLERESKREKDKDSSSRAANDSDDIIITKDGLINKVDPSKIWPDSCQISDIVRLQSRDGFWDLPSSFIASKFSGEMPSVPGLDLSESPILKKRVSSTLFTLGFLKKFFSENSGKWKFAKEKGIRWLMRIDSAKNWEEVVDAIISKIS